MEKGPSRVRQVWAIDASFNAIYSLGIGLDMGPLSGQIVDLDEGPPGDHNPTHAWTNQRLLPIRKPCRSLGRFAH